MVREQVQRLVSLGIWEHLPSSLLDKALKETPKLNKYWSGLHKKDKQADPKTRERFVCVCVWVGACILLCNREGTYIMRRWDDTVYVYIQYIHV